MSKYTVGQTVIVTAPRNRFQPGDKGFTQSEIVRVGSKYAYVKLHGREVGFSIANGSPKPDSNAWSLHLYTVEEHSDMVQRSALTSRIRNGGLEERGYKQTLRNLSIDQLTRIANILEEPRG